MAVEIITKEDLKNLRKQFLSDIKEILLIVRRLALKKLQFHSCSAKMSIVMG